MNLKVYQTVVILGFMVSCYLANVDTASISSNLTRCVNSYRNVGEEITAKCKYPSFKTIIFNLGKCMINTQNEVCVLQVLEPRQFIMCMLYNVIIVIACMLLPLIFDSRWSLNFELRKSLLMTR